MTNHLLQDADVNRLLQEAPAGTTITDIGLKEGDKVDLIQTIRVKVVGPLAENYRGSASISLCLSSVCLCVRRNGFTVWQQWRRLRQHRLLDFAFTDIRCLEAFCLRYRARPLRPLWLTDNHDFSIVEPDRSNGHRRPFEYHARPGTEPVILLFPKRRQFSPFI